ncbi:MAG TPA: tRNA (adenosine(37)-N6)-dimethylallyltransferase MiaA [bacterium]|nr:tRNA (adenosine(37)-N6)-dimethylallyltransferase MiaA [bacterium]
MADSQKPKTKDPKLPIIVGPTGVGKSEVAFQLAIRTGAEIVSADAFQVYQGLEVGTAQPSKEWQAKVPHHLVGVRDPKETWNAVEFAREASRILEEKDGTFLLVGGAGFYIRALVEGAPEGSSPAPEVRRSILQRVQELGNEGAWAWLQERDPQAAQRLHSNDLKRICRALEKTYPVQPVAPGYRPLGKDRVLFLGLERSRDKLDALLRERTRRMWSGGLLEETQDLLKTGLSQDHPVWGAIGYAEAALFLRGELGREEAVERTFRRTRQYAKRQWTWFRHQHEVRWFDLDRYPDTSRVVDDLVEAITA